MDLGNGALAQLQKHIPLAQIDAIVLTHLHFDHISDVQILGYALAQLQARREYERKIRLYLPKTPERVAGLFALPLFDICYLSDDLEVGEAGMRLVFASMMHPVEAYAVLAEEEGKCLLYSGDTAQNKTVAELAEMADFALLDAALLEAEVGPGASHMSVKEACEIGRFAGKLALTHHSPFHTREQICQEAAEEAVLAQSGMHFEI